MNRIDITINKAQAKKAKLLSPYITAGDPEPNQTVELMHALVKGGADIIELGIPFSDPMAEGKVIQAAMERALSHQVSLQDVLDMVREFRKKDTSTPVILMGYLNPIEQYGYEAFAKAAKKDGVDGTIMVDLPPEESESIMSIWNKANLYNIYLCSPTTSQSRMKRINHYAKGYIYFVSLKGVTGADTFDMESVKTQYADYKRQTNLPMMVGFGIKNATMAAKVAEFSDGVIVGAALISTINDAYNSKENILTTAQHFIADLRDAIDSGN